MERFGVFDRSGGHGAFLFGQGLHGRHLHRAQPAGAAGPDGDDPGGRDQGGGDQQREPFPGQGLGGRGRLLHKAGEQLHAVASLPCFNAVSAGTSTGVSEWPHCGQKRSAGP